MAHKENIIRWNRGIILCDVWIIIVLIIMQLSCMNDNGNNNVYAHMEMLVICRKEHSESKTLW